VTTFCLTNLIHISQLIPRSHYRSSKRQHCRDVSELYSVLCADG